MNIQRIRGGRHRAVAKLENAAGQLPDTRQLHLFELPHLLTQLLVFQNREQPGIDRGAVRPTGNPWDLLSRLRFSTHHTNHSNWNFP